MPVANPAYYLDDYTDEVLPVGLEGCTLEGWAKWLSKGGERSVREDQDEGPQGPWEFDPPPDGKVFQGSRLDFDEDICVERFPDDEDGPVLELSRDNLASYDFAAIRFGPGLGWSPDDILDPGRSLFDLCDKDCPVLEVGDEELIAVARSAKVSLVYRADPPRLEPVQ